MLIEKWLPLRKAAGEDGADPAIETPQVDDQVDETPEPQLAGKSSIRKSLDKAVESTRKAAEKAEKASKGKQPRRIAGGAVIDQAESTESEASEEPEVAETDEAEPEVAAPAALSAEAKAEWANTPKAIQDAFLKREADTQKGVDELKKKYSDIDTALQPHMEAIRRNGHSPAQAVTQLFAWMQALAGNPDVAFPALAKSFGYDIARFVPQNAATQQAQQAAQAAQQPDPNAQLAAEKPAYVAELEKRVEDLTKQIMGTQQTYQQDVAQRTNEVLMNWAKDKPHFDKVRGLMATFIQNGIVPLKDGQVDLDGAYDRAIYATPEVRQAILAEQEAAKQAAAKKKAEEAKKKAQEEANKARSRAVSLGNSAPGEPAAPGAKRGKGKSVRDSILEAREQLSE